MYQHKNEDFCYGTEKEPPPRPYPFCFLEMVAHVIIIDQCKKKTKKKTIKTCVRRILGTIIYSRTIFCLFDVRVLLTEDYL